jgi:hypothetical protein
MGMIGNSEALEKIQAGTATSAVYKRLLATLDRLGAYDVEGKKTSLHIVRRRAFLGVHPRKDGLLLNIVTERPIENSRVIRVEQVSKNRCHNEVKIISEKEIDEELFEWIRQAFALAE